MPTAGVSARPRRTPSSARSGYSLLELAVVVGVLGLIAGGLLTVSSSKTERRQIAKTDHHLETIQEAIERYAALNGRLPCPASLRQGQNTATFGRANCTTAAGGTSGFFETTPSGGGGDDLVRIGAVPVRSLGLPDSYMFDPWGNRVQYAVIKALTDATKYTSYATNLTTGVIDIKDTKGNAVTPQDDASTASVKENEIVAYALVSPGKDKRGAYTQSGGVSDAACATSLDAENCDNDATFIDGDLNDSDIAANAYYDKLIWQLYKAPPEEEEEEELSEVPNLVAVGAYHSCVVKKDATRTVWCWGKNDKGQLGDNSTTNRSLPVQVHGPANIGYLTDIVHLTAGWDHTCALKSDNTAWCWGNNDHHQLGDDTTTMRTTPVAVRPTSGSGQLNDIAQLSAGNGFTCALKTDGTPLCWGFNDNGRLGVNDEVERTRPTPVYGLTGASYITAEYDSACALENGNAWCWGFGIAGKLGTGPATQPWGYDSPPAPVRVHGVNDVGFFTSASQLSASSGNTCAVKSSDGGSVWCWGKNDYGNVGNGTETDDQNTPVQVKGLNGVGFLMDVQYVDVGEDHICGIRSTDDSVWCWGQNGDEGKLGINIRDWSSEQHTPVQVMGDGGAGYLVGASQLTVGYYHNCAILNNDPSNVWCWGDNTFGQLGDNSTTTRPVPVKVQGLN